jgi:hypothetical protein
MGVNTMARVREKRIHWRKIITVTCLAIFAFWTVTFLSILWAEPSAQRTFDSPGQASRALFFAVQTGDESAILEIFGVDGKEIVSSGDMAQDQANRAQFARKYQEMNRLVEEPDGTVRLYIGAENWPLPVPLVRKGDAWYFDTAAGKQEIWFRQIGANETAAIQVLQELVDAQKEYYAEARDGEAKQYTQKFRSDERKHNGLYWKTNTDEPESPIGPDLANAGRDTNAPNSSPGAHPFYGYYFAALTQQGEHAVGGAKNYIVDGKMTEGFGFLAYPAQYATSGVMTFMMSQDGAVYQKDLGLKTAGLANSMSVFDPNSTWAKLP